jgi:hypothetical protein
MGVFSSCEQIPNRRIPGIDYHSVMLEDDVLLINFVERLRVNAFGQSRRNILVPHYVDAAVEVRKRRRDRGIFVKAKISVEDLFNKNIHALPKRALPGGRAIPGVIDGVLPATRVPLGRAGNNKVITIYQNRDVFAFFYPHEHGQRSEVTPYYVEEVQVGHLVLIEADENGRNEGFLYVLPVTEKMRDVMRYRLSNCLRYKYPALIEANDFEVGVTLESNWMLDDSWVRTECYRRY